MRLAAVEVARTGQLELAIGRNGGVLSESTLTEMFRRGKYALQELLCHPRCFGKA